MSTIDTRPTHAELVAKALDLDPSELRNRAADDLRTLRANPDLARRTWKALKAAQNADQGLADLTAQFGRGEAVLGLQGGLAPCCDQALLARRVVAALVADSVHREGGAT